LRLSQSLGQTLGQTRPAMRPVVVVSTAPVAWPVTELALFVFITDSHPLPGPLQTPGVKVLEQALLLLTGVLLLVGAQVHEN